MEIEYLFKMPVRDRQDEKYQKRYVRYWRKIERKFRFKRFFKRPEFVLYFRHLPFGNVVYDDELAIEQIAKYYGYRIKDEQLYSDISTYLFERNEAS